LPEYTLDSEPDYPIFGKKVDTLIEDSLSDGNYLYRALGIEDHPDLDLDQLVSKIKKLGTDKYDLNRKEVCHEDFEMYDHDIQAGIFKIKKGKLILGDNFEHNSLFGDTIKKFFFNVLYDRGYKVRIDLIIIYYKNKFENAKIVGSKPSKLRQGLDKYLFKFKEPKNKKESIAAIIKILR